VRESRKGGRVSERQRGKERERVKGMESEREGEGKSGRVTRRR
jgi:hypothetical protein